MFSYLYSFLSKGVSHKIIDKLTIFIPSMNYKPLIKSGIPHFTEHVVYNRLRSKIKDSALLNLPYTTKNGTFYNFTKIKTINNLKKIRKSLFSCFIKNSSNISNIINHEKENILYEKQLVDKNPINRLLNRIENEIFENIQRNNPHDCSLYYKPPVEGTYKDISTINCKDITKYYKENYKLQDAIHIIYSKRKLKNSYRNIINQPINNINKTNTNNKHIITDSVLKMCDSDENQNTIIYCKLKSINNPLLKNVENNFIDMLVNELLCRNNSYFSEVFNIDYNDFILEGIVFNKETQSYDLEKHFKKGFKNLILRLNKNDVNVAKKSVIKNFRFNKLINSESTLMKFNDLLISNKPECIKSIFINKYKLQYIEQIIRSITFEDIFNRLCKINALFTNK